MKADSSPNDVERRRGCGVRLLMTQVARIAVPELARVRPMGILSWLFSRADDEVLPPPPLDARASSAHHTQRQGGLVGAPKQTLSRFDVEELAATHGVSSAAIETLASALARSQGRAAQFSHPELGGMGQWMSGGMLMIGDMFNHELKARVDRLCHAVAAAIAARPATPSGAAAAESVSGSIG